MKKQLSFMHLLILAILLTFIPTSTFASHENITVILDGEKIEFDVQPTIINGRTMVPLRAIFEALGAEVTWDDATQTVEADKNNTYIKLAINNSTMYVNSVPKNLDVPATLVNSRTLVPVRAISEAFECEVKWDDTTSTVFIYSKNYIDLNILARKLEKYQSPTTLTISLMSDTHYHDSDRNAAKKIETAKAMGILSNICHIDFIGNLGDMIRGNEDMELSRNAMSKLVLATNENATCPVLFVRGNHDDNGWYSYGRYGGTYLESEILTDKEWYQSVFGIEPNGVETDINNPHGCYGYWDDTKSKIRVFLLNSQDFPYVTDNGVYRYNGYVCLAYSNAQLNFIANSLMFSEKENPSEWAALFLSHVPLDTTNKDGYRFGAKDHLPRGHECLLAIISAYRKGTTFNYTGSNYYTDHGDMKEDFNVSIDIDYTSKGAGDVIGFISGHTHADHFSRRVGYENSLSRNYAFLGLMGSTQFSTFIIDRENSTIHVVKYGDSVPITNEREDLAGSVQDAPDVGTIECGEWSVDFDQFRPNNTNLYNGLSEIHTGGGISNTTQIDISTLEVDVVTENLKYRTSKAIAVKPFTRYAIPADWNGSILALGASGKKSSFIKPTTADGYKYFQTGIRQYYIVFDHHIGSYTDYANFWIKEMGEGVEYN